MRLALALLTISLVAMTSLAHAMIDTDQITRVVRDHRAELLACYAAACATAPQLAGRLTIVMTIDESGAVVDAQIGEDQLGSPTMNACMVDAVRKWMFPAMPPGSGSIVIRYPFHFAP